MRALQVTGVSKVFPDGTVALKDVSFSIEAGQLAVIAGSNGSGKSVLMTLIASLDVPTEGTIELFGNTCGLVFQDADAQILGETPGEDVAFGAKNVGLKKEALKQRVSSSLEAVGLLDKRSAAARTLSGGEKRRLAVAGILAMQQEQAIPPRGSLVIFDEPFANLDWTGVRQVCAIMRQLKAEGKTQIVLTHEIEKVLALADRFIVLDKGQVRFEGTPKEGLTQDLEAWAIRNPLSRYNSLEDLVWL